MADGHGLGRLPWNGSCRLRGTRSPSLSRFSQRRAFTMLELVVVLGIMAVVVGLGIGMITDQFPRFRSVQVAKDLRQDVTSLRTTAIERGVETRLLLETGDSSVKDPSSPNAGSWRLQVGNAAMASKTWTDLNESGRGVVSIEEGANHYAKGVSLAEWENLSGPWFGNESAIVFSPRGWVENPDGDFGTDGYITLSVVNKVAWKDGVDDHIDLKVSRSGNVTMVSSLSSRDAGSVGTGSASEGS